MRNLLFIALIFLMLIGCTSPTIRAEEVIVKEVNGDSIVVENMNGEKTTVMIPKGISKLITVENQYFVKYEVSSKDKKEGSLIEIDPNPK